MRPLWVVPVAVIAAVTAYAIFDRRCRHQEVVARTIAFGARLRAQERSWPGDRTGRSVHDDPGKPLA